MSLLGAKLEALREAAGLGIVEAAQQLDVGRDSLRFWEQEIKRPRAKNLRRAAALFHVPVDALTDDSISVERILQLRKTPDTPSTLTGSNGEGPPPSPPVQPTSLLRRIPVYRAKDLSGRDWSNPASLASLSEGTAPAETADQAAFFVIGDTPETSVPGPFPSIYDASHQPRLCT